jgi:hypothetical protein
MSNEPSLDLSNGDEHFETFLEVVTTIADLLIESADPDDLDDEAREAIRATMDEMATIILAELNFQIINVLSDGTIMATLKLGEFSN